jgi:cytochrome c oxidase subunit 4
MAQLAHDVHDDHSDNHGHPTELTYVKIALFLALITIIEVAIYYVDWFHTSGALVPSLIVLSVIKFYTVVSFFMHLKFDHKLLTFWMSFGLFLGGVVVIVLMLLFGSSHPIDYATRMLEPLKDVLPS